MEIYLLIVKVSNQSTKAPRKISFKDDKVHMFCARSEKLKLIHTALKETKNYSFMVSIIQCLFGNSKNKRRDFHSNLFLAFNNVKIEKFYNRH